jgi:hypothetical protein
MYETLVKQIEEYLDEHDLPPGTNKFSQREAKISGKKGKMPKHGAGLKNPNQIGGKKE